MSASSTDAEGYAVPAACGSAEVRDRGSRFLAVVEPVRDETSALQRLEAICGLYPGATHHCWAWRLGQPPRERVNDCGEPRGTAGLPILMALRGASLSDVLAVVVRWFGGIKLGKGGLARAYAAAIREALAGVPSEQRVATSRLAVEVPYERLGAVRRLLHPPEIVLLGESFGQGASVELEVWRSRRRQLEESLAALGLSAVARAAEP